MTTRTLKQIFLGVAVAGIVAGAGSTVATVVAFAEPTDSDAHTTVEGGTTVSSGGATDATQPVTVEVATTPASQTITPSGDSTSSTTPTGLPASSTSGTTSPQTGLTWEPVSIPSAGTVDPPSGSTSHTPISDSGTPTLTTHESASLTTGLPPATSLPEAVTLTWEPVSIAPAENFAPSLVSPQATAFALDSAATTPVAPALDAAPVLMMAAGPDIPAPAPIPLPLPIVPVVPATPTSATSFSSLSSSTNRTRAASAGDTVAQLIDPTTQHVLVIGIDGTNLSRVMADPNNLNWFEVMDTSTNSAPSIVGHTTISNPSWTTILTGVWDEKHGVFNNVFTPETYNSWPTVFNLLEAYDPAIQTKAIADWDVITKISGAGAYSADDIVPIAQISGDTNWSLTDAAVTAEAVKSILGTDTGYEDVPNFLFTYLVQVDENGHMFGGASPEYAAAISRTDTNIGLIMDAVAARELATGEDWTVIMVTDHGHQPEQGFGHGFQSPDETITFVIVDGPDFGDGLINTEYEIADVTPTVLSLFGAPLRTDFDGVPLTSLSGSDVLPADLHQALQDQIDANQPPDTITNLALSLRTIFGTVPYVVYTQVNDYTKMLQEVVDSGEFPASIIAAVALVPLQIGGNALYLATNIPAVIVARLTGSGVIPPSDPPLQMTMLQNQVLLVCGGGKPGSAADMCSAGNVAV